MNFLEDLAHKNKLTVLDEKIVVKPLSKWSGQTYPLNMEDESLLHLTVEEYIGLKERLYQFTDDLKELEYFDMPAKGSSEAAVGSGYSTETIEAAIAELQGMLSSAGESL